MFTDDSSGHGGLGGGISGSMGVSTKSNRLSQGNHLTILFSKDIYVSPNDPLFYLHHAYIDRLW